MEGKHSPEKNPEPAVRIAYDRYMGFLHRLVMAMPVDANLELHDLSSVGQYILMVEMGLGLWKTVEYLKQPILLELFPGCR